MTLTKRKKTKKEKDITLRMKENSFKIIHEYAEARGLRKYFTLSNAKINIIYNRDNDVLRNNDDYYDYD